jgi:hypothetical protein
MNIYLMAFATDRKGMRVKCTFQALVGVTASSAGTPLSPTANTNDTEPFYLIPSGTAEVSLTATPQDKASPVWQKLVVLTVGTSGVTAKSGWEGFVRLKSMQHPLTGDIGINATVILSRFQEVTADMVGVLKSGEFTNHHDKWEAWPPQNWGLANLKSIPFIDAKSPVKSGALNFPPSDLEVHATSMVLQLAGVDAPQLFGVTWPDAIKPGPGITPIPTPFFIFLEQTLTGNGASPGTFVGAYPNSFDYVDMLYNQTHYEDDAPFSWDQFVPKGVPFQVAKAGANAVTVVPLNSLGIEYGQIQPDPTKLDKGETEVLSGFLEDLQAFMFMNLAVPNPPSSIGKTAIAAFSSANHILYKWLDSEVNRGGNFLKNIVKAVYFLDPTRDPKNKDWDVNTYIDSALRWAGNPKITDKRIRLYMRDHSDAHARLLGTFDDAKGTMVPTKALPSRPYVSNSSDGLRTAGELHEEYWIAAVHKINPTLQIDKPDEWLFAHHMFAATILTHALSQGPIQDGKVKTDLGD